MRRIFMIVPVLATLAIAIAPQQASAGTLGCLLGAAAGGLGGAQIGSGRGQLAAVAVGTLVGCGAGSSIQNSDQRQYQQQTYQPRYQPQYGQRNYHINYSQPRWQRRVPYTVARPVYIPRITWQQSQRNVVQSNRYCREYQQPIIVGGKQVDGYGQTCSYDGGRSWDLGPLQRIR